MNREQTEAEKDARAEELRKAYAGAPSGFIADVGSRIYTVTFTCNPPFTVAAVTWGKGKRIEIGIARCNSGDEFDPVEGSKLALRRACFDGTGDAETNRLPGRDAEKLIDYFDRGLEEEKRQAEEYAEGDESDEEAGMRGLAEGLGHHLAQDESLEYPEDGCDGCEHADNCPILKGFNDGRAEMAKARNAQSN